MKNVLFITLIAVSFHLEKLSGQNRADELIDMLSDSLYLDHQPLVEAKQLVPPCWQALDISGKKLFARQPNPKIIRELFTSLIDLEESGMYDPVLKIYNSYVEVAENQYEPLIRIGKRNKCFEGDYDLFADHFEIIHLFESALTAFEIREQNYTAERILDREKKSLLAWYDLSRRKGGDYLREYIHHSEYYRKLLLNRHWSSYGGTMIDYLSIYSNKITPTFVEYLSNFKFEQEEIYKSMNDEAYELLVMKNLLMKTHRIIEEEHIDKLEEFVETSFTYFAENNREVWFYDAAANLKTTSNIPLFLLDSLYYSAHMSDISLFAKDYRFRNLLGANNLEDIKAYIKSAYLESKTDHSRRFSLFLMRYFPDPDFIALNLELLKSRKTSDYEKDLAKDNLIGYLSASSVSEVDRKNIQDAL